MIEEDLEALYFLQDGDREFQRIESRHDECSIDNFLMVQAA